MQKPKLGKIKLLSAKEQVAAVLRKAILSRELVEGQEITLEGIAGMVGVSTEQVKASGRFQHPPELGQTVIQPLKVIFVPFPLIVPTVGFHLEVRRIGNNQVNGIIRQGLNKMQAISVD